MTPLQPEPPTTHHRPLKRETPTQPSTQRSIAGRSRIALGYQVQKSLTLIPLLPLHCCCWPPACPRLQANNQLLDLPDSLSQLACLEQLHAGFNALQDLPDCWECFPSLKLLSVPFNKLQVRGCSGVGLGVFVVLSGFSGLGLGTRCVMSVCL
jgi:hypothetical protein